MADKTKKSFFETAEPFLIVGIFSVIMYVGYQTFFSGELEKFLPGGKLHTATQKQQLDERKTYLTSLTRLDTLYKESQKDVSKQVETLVPADQGIPQIFASYESLAGRYGVNIQSIDIVADKSVAQTEKGGLQSLLVSMKIANASYDSVKLFLDAVEKNIRIADVQSISFDPRSRFIDISIRTYYRTVSPVKY